MLTVYFHAVVCRTSTLTEERKVPGSPQIGAIVVIVTCDNFLRHYLGQNIKGQDYRVMQSSEKMRHNFR